MPIQIASVSGSTTTYIIRGIHRLRIQMKDNGYNEINITKPFLIVTNLSDQTISGFKVRVWFSREEFSDKQIIVDSYYKDPGTLSITKGVHPLNSKYRLF